MVNMTKSHPKPPRKLHIAIIVSMLLALASIWSGCDCGTPLPSTHLGTVEDPHACLEIGADAKAGNHNGTFRRTTFFFPFGIALFENRLYIADYGNDLIRQALFTDGNNQGETTTLSGKTKQQHKYRNGHFEVALFHGPSDIATDYRFTTTLQTKIVDGKTQKITHKVPYRLYLADTKNHQIRVLDLESRQVQTLAGKGTSGLNDGAASEALFFHPSAIAVYPKDPTTPLQNDKRFPQATPSVPIAPPAPILFIADTDNHVIRLALQATLHESCQTSGRTNSGYCIFTIAGTGECRPDPQKTRFSGAFLGCMNDPRNKDAKQYQLNSPSGIAVAKNGTIFVSDTKNHRILKIKHYSKLHDKECPTQGCYQIEHIAGGWKIETDKTNNKQIYVPHKGFKNGCGQSALFYFPKGLTVDEQGNVYVADFSNSRIRKLSPRPNGEYCVTTMQRDNKEIQIPQPVGIAINEQKQEMFVSRGYGTSHKIYRFDYYPTLFGTQTAKACKE